MPRASALKVLVDDVPVSFDPTVSSLTSSNRRFTEETSTLPVPDFLYAHGHMDVVPVGWFARDSRDVRTMT